MISSRLFTFATGGTIGYGLGGLPEGDNTILQPEMIFICLSLLVLTYWHRRITT